MKLKNLLLIVLVSAVLCACHSNYQPTTLTVASYNLRNANGIAANGGKPVYGVYSTFIQRSYDQLSQDLCINNNPAVLLVFWGTLSGMNDVTHLCFFDIPLISNIPNMVYLAPTCKEEYLAMLEWSIRQNEHPVAIRVPATDS